MVEMFKPFVCMANKKSNLIQTPIYICDPLRGCDPRLMLVTPWN